MNYGAFSSYTCAYICENASGVKKVDVIFDTNLASA
jgi:hypothetical protein